MKEIGGFFGLEELINNEYHSDLIALNIGRNALLYILQAKKIRKLYIPYYLCDSISDVCIRNDYKIEFYNINDNFLPLFDRKLNSNDYIFIVNYFGQINDNKMLELKEKYKNIIIDNTQAFFQKPIKGIDTIYSCRKFFGVPDGGYLSTNTSLSQDLKFDVSKNRMSHILGRYEGLASDYYSASKDNDLSLIGEPLKLMSKITHNIMGAIDYEKVRYRRNENYSFLERELGPKNKYDFIKPDGPFAYPFYAKNGIKIRKAMIQNKIYIPMLWPNVLKDKKTSCVEHDYATNILPLPCDQRYKIADMKCLLKELIEVE